MSNDGVIQIVERGEDYVLTVPDGKRLVIEMSPGGGEGAIVLRDMWGEREVVFFADDNGLPRTVLARNIVEQPSTSVDFGAIKLGGQTLAEYIAAEVARNLEAR